MLIIQRVAPRRVYGPRGRGVPGPCQSKTKSTHPWARTSVALYTAQQGDSLCPRGAKCCATGGADETSTVQRIKIDTQQARKTLLLEPLQEGKDQSIIISGVAQGSEAWEEGVRPGQRLVGISDPNNNQVWELNASTSLRFVRDALKYRIGGTIILDIDTATVGQAAEAPSQANKAADVAQAQQVPDPGAMSSVDALDSVLRTMNEPLDDGDQAPLTIAQQLEDVSRQRQREKSQVEDRIAARRGRLSEVGERDDSGFFAAVAAAFFLPPLVILVWAYSSGYLDALASQY